MADSTDAARLIIVLEAQSTKMQRQLVDVTKQIDRFSDNVTKRFAQMNATNAASFEKLGSQVRGSLGGITTALGAIGLGTGIKQVLDYANTWVQLENKLKSASTYSGLQARSIEDINTAASAARTPLENYLGLYTRILNVSGNLHLTELQVAQTTDLVSKAFKIGGSTAAQQAGGIIQIIEALDMGRVQGRQLRALSTDAIVVSQALAAYMHTTVGGLKALGAAGKITSEDLIQAILAYNGKINAAFNSTEVSISDAVTKIENAFMQFVGTTGESSGAIKKLVDALTYLADNFKTIAPIVLDFVAIIGGALAARAVVGFGAAIGEATFALATFLSTMAAGEITMAGLAVAMGPLALLAGAAAAALYVLSANSGQASGATQQLSKDIELNASKLTIATNASVAYRQALRAQISTQLTAAEAALEEAGAQYQAAKAKQALREALPPKTQGLYNALDGISGNAFGTDPYAGADDALKQINAARDNLQKVLNQQAKLNQIDKLPPGTADQAPGDGNTNEPLGDKTKGNAYDSATQSLQKQTDALNAETAAQAKLNPFINDYGFALDKAKASSDLLSAATASGVKVTPELSAAIDKAATNFALADAAAKKFAESQKQLVAEAEAWRDTIKGATSSFITDLINGKSAAEALGSALTSIGNQLLSMGLDQLFGAGTFGGSSKFGLIGQAFGFANGGIAARGMPVFAGGGVSSTASIFGEAGPEAAVPLPDGRRIPVDLRIPANSNGGNITYAPNIDARGADSSAVAALARAMAVDKAQFESKVIGTFRAAKRARKL